MADYHPLIARAVAGLEKNTGDARRALYERARTALVAQLRGVQPALSDSDVIRERLALEEAIRKVEAESVRQTRAESPRWDPTLKVPAPKMRNEEEQDRARGAPPPGPPPPPPRLQRRVTAQALRAERPEPARAEPVAR